MPQHPDHYLPLDHSKASTSSLWTTAKRQPHLPGSQQSINLVTVDQSKASASSPWTTAKRQPHPHGPQQSVNLIPMDHSKVSTSSPWTTAKCHPRPHELQQNMNLYPMDRGKASSSSPQPQGQAVFPCITISSHPKATCTHSPSPGEVSALNPAPAPTTCAPGSAPGPCAAIHPLQRSPPAPQPSVWVLKMYLQYHLSCYFPSFSDKASACTQHPENDLQTAAPSCRFSSPPILIINIITEAVLLWHCFR